MKFEDLLNEAIKPISNKHGDDFITYIKKDFKLAKLTIKKLNNYTSLWKNVQFSNDEIKWLINIPNRPKRKGYMYHGSTVDIDNKKQYNSWSMTKSKTKYFMRGNGIPRIYKEKIPNNKNFVDVTFFLLLLIKYRLLILIKLMILKFTILLMVFNFMMKMNYWFLVRYKYIHKN